MQGIRRGAALRQGAALVAALAALASAMPRRAAGAPRSERTVVVLLFDGFAPVWAHTAGASVFDRLRREGAWSDRLVPVFPTTSSVNQVTLSTGCWPEHHGIVANEFRDPHRGWFREDVDADWLSGCRYLHDTAEAQGVRAAALGWVGRYSSRRGRLATYVSPATPKTKLWTDAQQAEEVIRLLRLPDPERPRLILAYFRDPDQTAHSWDMDSDRTRRAVRDSASRIAAILTAIDGLPYRGRVTLIVTTDHGMRSVSSVINVEQILRRHGIAAQVASWGTTSFLYLRDPSRAAADAAQLSGYSEFDAVPKTALPPAWHLGAGPRVGDVILSAHPPYVVEDVRRWPRWAQWLADWGPEFIWARYEIEAAHGYPPDTPGMEGILYAWGAGIATGRHVAAVSILDVEPTICRLLGIDAGRVDGHVAVELLAPDAP